MFERRLKLFLLVVLALATLLVLRTLQVQLLDGTYWRRRAAETMTRSHLIETTRGSILDYRGREIAVDVACIDACVDYRAIVYRPDEKWLRAQAALRLRNTGAWRDASRAQRRQMISDEVPAVKADIERLWATLGNRKITGKTPEEIDEIRRQIIQRVEMRRRYLWYQRYKRALAQREGREPAPWYRQWLINELSDAPQLDSFSDDVAEQTEAHVVVRAISTEANNLLGKNLERFPGLVLRPSTHRTYPYGAAGCHLVGHMARVTREDLQADENTDDELRQYYPNDLIGRGGLEALCEPALRGRRGRIERSAGNGSSEETVDQAPAVPGRSVKTTIDIELQAEVQQLFRRGGPGGSEMHGAAVVIDVASGQVRALVSYPDYDLNTLQENYSQLIRDEINKPLLSRATQAALEPGSTVKPIVGLAAISEGLATPQEGVECTGYLVLHGKKYASGFRCWVASKFFEDLHGQVAHHPIPWDDPHPTGFLTFRDALERSCNVYFEVMADRLGAAKLADWYGRFGLGRVTGLGVPESAGRVPEASGPTYRRLATTWLAGIGQGQVAATPIQMANVAATIARGGMWMRPRLVEHAGDADPRRLSDSAGHAIPDRVDMQLKPAAVAAAREGMVRVVNSRAGTGEALRRPDVLVAGKTGTAQAARFSVRKREADGREVLDERGRPVREFLEPSTSAWTNPLAPWYRGSGREEKSLAHAWFIGYAPANRPQIAFAVLVEYGGSGGVTAAGIARQVLEACVEHGYLALDGKGIAYGEPARR